MSQKFCQNCGAKITGEYRFCTSCGARLDLFENEDLLCNNKSSKRNYVILVIFILILLLVVVIMGIFLIKKNKEVVTNENGIQKELEQDNTKLEINNYGQSIENQNDIITENNTHIYGSDTRNELVLYVDQDLKKEIVLKYENGSNRFALGWVSPAQVTLVTDIGTYYTTIPYVSGEEIGAGENGEISLYFEEMEGIPKTLTIENINLLKNGLPSTFDGGYKSVIDITIE